MTARRFTLVVRPDGQALLTTPERLQDGESRLVLEVLEGWAAGRFPIAVIPECDVVQVKDVTIDLAPAETLTQAAAGSGLTSGNGAGLDRRYVAAHPSLASGD